MTREDQQALVQQYLHALRAGADFRDRKVRRLRAAIRSGAFENRLKLEVASDRLAGELLGYERAGAELLARNITGEESTPTPE